MHSVWESILLGILAIPIMLMKALFSKNSGFKQIQKSIEVTSEGMVDRFQVSQLHNPIRK